MKYYQVSDSLVVKSWCSDPQQSAVDQAINLAKLPFAFHHIALMPDTHQGYGMPIGGVMATKGVVVPNAVGVDIGCGMCVVKTGLTGIPMDKLKQAVEKIRQRIPVGFCKHARQQDGGRMPDGTGVGTLQHCIVDENWDKALLSLGTLGGGNHFIEIQKGDDEHIWIMIHSGSRNLGKQVADYYNKKAVIMNELYHSFVPKEWGLAFLPLNSEEGDAYMEEMQYCVEYAVANRKLMMDRVIDIFDDTFNLLGADFMFDPILDVAHNYAVMENHFGQNVLVHRKGATSARLNQPGVIPGSQGTCSYVVRGKGNADSFNSCSRGAGRKMGRKEAERTLNLEEEQKRLDDKGVLHAIRSVGDLDEAPGAYKDIDVVIEEQKDLVDVVVKLTPLAVIKG